MIPSSALRRTAAALVFAAVAAPSIGAQGAPPVTICLAPASVQVVSGSSADGGATVRDLFASFLSGPTLAVQPLASRLASQAREEARQASCRYVLYTSMKLERGKSGGGLFGKVVGGAVESSAWELRGAATSAAGRVVANAAASAATEAARGLATNVKTKDELTLDYRLETIDGATLVKNTAKAKASSDGQDLLTQIIERAAESIGNAVAAPR